MQTLPSKNISILKQALLLCSILFFVSCNSEGNKLLETVKQNISAIMGEDERGTEKEGEFAPIDNISEHTGESNSAPITKGESSNIESNWDSSIYSLESLGLSEMTRDNASGNVFYNSISDLVASTNPIQETDLTKKFIKTRLRGNLAEEMQISQEDNENQFGIRVLEREKSPWGINKGVQLKDLKFNKNDKYVFVFHARCISSSDESGDGKITLQIKKLDAKKGGGPLLSKSITLGKKSELYAVPFMAHYDGAGFNFQLLLGNTKPQEVVIGKLSLLQYPSSMDLGELPKSQTRYPGMELDADWRKEAHERILKYRTAQSGIRVLDANGNAIRDLDFDVKLVKHEFGFGAAFSIKRLFDPSKYSDEDRKKYAEIIIKSFNKVTIENGLKWKLYQFFKDFVPPAMDWIRENDLPLRGHTLIWPGWKKSPKHLPELSKDKEAFRQAVMERVSSFSSKWTDLITEWDVLNEPFSNTDFMDVLGKDIVLDIFNEAERVNPSVIKYINDYAILAGNHTEHQDNYYGWIEYLKANNAPLDGVGFQGHFRSPIPPTEVWNRIARFAKFGYQMQITEYDFDDSDEILQARYTRDFMTLVFSHPKMTGIVCWTLYNQKDRINQSMYRADWSPKLMMQAWDHLISKVWTTQLKGKTDNNGEYPLKGFKGKYIIQFMHNGKMHEKHFKLTNSSEPIIISL